MKKITKSSKELIRNEAKISAHNYHPIPVVFSKALGANVWDVEDKKYIDFLSAYSAVNQGHCHPKIVQAMVEQASRCALSSRAFYNDVYAEYAEKITKLFKYDMVLPMNTGAEAVETALKLARKWGYLRKNIPENNALIFGFSNNFHGRTLGVISMSTELENRKDFGPFLPGVSSVCPSTNKILNFNDLSAIECVLKKNKSNTAAVIFEPIQGEAGIVCCNDFFIAGLRLLCNKYNVLLIADEIQTGLARTGKLLACDWFDVRPDIVLLGKALSGGMYPVSAVLADECVMMCIKPGEHGSTYGGNPLGCAIAIAALDVIIDEKLAEKSERLGCIFREKIRSLESPLVLEVRGKGLLNAVVIDESKCGGKNSWHICLLLAHRGVLAKPTHGNIIRMAPPLVITEEEMINGINIFASVLKDITEIAISDIPNYDY